MKNKVTPFEMLTINTGIQAITEESAGSLRFHFKAFHNYSDFPVAQLVKNLSAMQETQVLSLGPVDPLEKEMATHFSILAWRSPYTEEPGGLWT